MLLVGLQQCHVMGGCCWLAYGNVILKLADYSYILFCWNSSLITNFILITYVMTSRNPMLHSHVMLCFSTVYIAGIV